MCEDRKDWRDMRCDRGSQVMCCHGKQRGSPSTGEAVWERKAEFPESHAPGFGL